MISIYFNAIIVREPTDIISREFVLTQNPCDLLFDVGITHANAIQIPAVMVLPFFLCHKFVQFVQFVLFSFERMVLFQPLSAHKLYDIKLCLAFFEVGFLDSHFHFHFLIFISSPRLITLPAYHRSYPESHQTVAFGL